MPKSSVSATRLAGSAPVAGTGTRGRTPPSGPRTRPSMAPVVVWAVAAAAAVKLAARSQRQGHPLLLGHIPHLLLEIGACRPCLARAGGLGVADRSAGGRTGAGVAAGVPGKLWPAAEVAHVAGQTPLRPASPACRVP